MFYCVLAQITLGLIFERSEGVPSLCPVQPKRIGEERRSSMLNLHSDAIPVQRFSCGKCLHWLTAKLWAGLWSGRALCSLPRCAISQ